MREQTEVRDLSAAPEGGAVVIYTREREGKLTWALVQDAQEGRRNMVSAAAAGAGLTVFAVVALVIERARNKKRERGGDLPES